MNAGPKGYLGHGTAVTSVHCDVTDAINHCFYAESPSPDNGAGGARWTTIHRDDMDLATEWLASKKQGYGNGHPIHAQTIFLTANDVEELVRDGIRATTFIQEEGESVIVPAGVPHQVR